MKPYLFSCVTLVVLGLSYVPACGGKSETTMGSEHGKGGAGGASGEGFAGVGAGPATHASECESLCERTTTEGCTEDTTSCLLVCATVTGYGACQPEVQKWLDCAKKSEVTCDSSGVPSFASCEMLLMSVSACALAEDPPKAVAKSCADFCDELDGTSCSIDTELGGCSEMCGIFGMVVTACQPKFVAYTNCQTKAGIACDDAGNLSAAGCESEQLVYLGCLMTEVGEGTL